MAATRTIIKAAFFCDGTVSTINKNPDNILGRMFSRLMCSPNNSIGQLYENCEEQYKYYFPGPGADICSNNKSSSFTITKAAGTLLGAIDGTKGSHGIEKNLDEIKTILIELGKNIKASNSKVEINVHSWSRGGYLAWRIKKLVTELIEQGLIDVDSIHLINIDPVAGGPFDRYDLWMNSHKKDPEVPIHYLTFYSDSGNLRYWPFQRNMTFFSGLIVDEHHPNAKRYLCKGHHEALVGKSGDEHYNHPDRLVGNVVLGHIVEESSLQFNKEWSEQVLKEYKRSLDECQKLNLIPKTDRGFLSPHSTSECFWGKTMVFTNLIDLAKKAVNDITDKNLGDIDDEDVISSDVEDVDDVVSDSHSAVAGEEVIEANCIKMIPSEFSPGKKMQG